MKKLLSTLALTIALTLSANADAAQHTVSDKGERYDYKYPVFSLENDKAASKINKDIAKMLKKSRNELRDTNMQHVGSTYEVKFENEQYVSLTFTTSNYYSRAAHGMYYVHGLVYDKLTGSRVPYTKFIPKLKEKELKQAILSKKYPVYHADLSTPNNAPFLADWDDFYVSKDYILAEDGKAIYLIYQPYELDCYAAGPTFVKIAIE